ncbi:MAG: hypothetical protein ACXVDW_13565 [Bacteroidia bacterium]
MTSAIMISLVIPALVAATLTVLLIKERDYFFNNRQPLNHRRSKLSGKEVHSRNKSEDHKNDKTYIDFSGRMLGL